MNILGLNRVNDPKEVKQLQKQLKKAHFSPGLVDGVFGPATNAAVIAFQKSHCLLAYGIVGSRTAFSLCLIKGKVSNNALPYFTSITVSYMFPHTQVDNINENLPHVLESLASVALTQKPMVLMALSTIRAETESFRPISEYQSKYNTSPGGHPFDLYDYRRDLGNSRKGHGEKYKGRGFIQLTGRHNYEHYGKKIGLGTKLLRTPDWANRPNFAAALLAAFLKEKETPIKNALLLGNFTEARRLVNGGSHGLGSFIETYMIGDERVPDDI